MASEREESPTVRRRRLAAELRRLRKESNLTTDQVAKALEVSQSSISRIETARQGIKINDLRALLTLYQVPEDKATDLLTLARQARQQGWWQVFGDVVPESFQAFVGLETEARQRRSYDMSLIPGLLQTPDYHRALVDAELINRTSEEVDRKIEFRLARQRQTLGNDDLELCFIVDEASLHRLPENIKTGQLPHLIETSERPNVNLHVLPFGTGIHAAMDGSFVILGFGAPDPDVVYIETQLSGLYLEQPAAVRRYNLVYEDLRAKTLDARMSRNLLAKLAKEV
ncbi:helix-turn-helix domain-containing protein [Streptosporangium sp. NBC_01495]|uniref:helix-turn-helix domain-containing protein n=1 Tax=Streptosporangium sp. NBC_01495 TaxID=2903899 RepID=UPI002E35AC44|nr:helix-turn-helix transcriptional regulator [Streptosporangium sp. NBC_01495]